MKTRAQQLADKLSDDWYALEPENANYTTLNEMFKRALLEYQAEIEDDIVQQLTDQYSQEVRRTVQFRARKFVRNA